MDLYSYTITHDTGFAPNPFWGFCTLATCKPEIRRKAQVGDWVVGLTPKGDGNRIAYAMRVDEVLSYREYYWDERFSVKIPDFDRGPAIFRCGDNIYKPLGDDGYEQLRSRHSNGIEENEKNKKRDLKGMNALISEKFHYFGSQRIDLPIHLSKLIVTRGHRKKFSEEEKQAFLEFISSKPKGLIGEPINWKSGDKSWLLGLK